MGLIDGLIKLMVKQAVRNHMGEYAKAAKTVAAKQWTFADKIADLKRDHGLPADYVADLIKRARSVESLKQIKMYLQSDRNDMRPTVTNKLLEQATSRAKSIAHAQQLHDHIHSLPDPFAYGGHIEHTIHNILDWMV